MADFESKLRWLSERGNPVGAEELIERIEADLAGDPLVVLKRQREGTIMTKTQQSPATKQPGRYRGPVWGVVTFIAVLAVAGLYFALANPPTAPAVQDRDPATMLVASYFKIHDGWALVYADGRVLYNLDGDRIYSRHLTPAALDLIRSGELAPNQILRWGLLTPPPPDDLWADPEPGTYQPVEYAACVVADDVGSVDATSVLGQLPPAAQALLRGKQRAYTAFGLVIEPDEPVECFALTPQEHLAESLDQTSDDWPPQLQLIIGPVLPHGEIIAWGG